MSVVALKLVDKTDDRALADKGRDDIGNAERLIARHGEDLRRTTGIGVFVYDGKRWVLDPDEMAATRRAQATARAIRAEAKTIEAELEGIVQAEAKELLEEKLEKHQKWAVASSNQQRLKAMLTQAWPHLDLPLSEWNAKPALFVAGNGTLDLSGLEPVFHKAHRREDHVTHIAGVDYDPKAECPHFRAYIDRVLPPEKIPDGAGGFIEDRSLQKFVQRTLGVCLIDSAADRCIIIFHGGGSNGKSTVLNVVCAVLGDYSQTAAVESLLYNEHKTGSGPSPDIARLGERPRLVRASEPEPGAKMAEGGVKQLTGGEPITARGTYEKKIIEFTPNFKTFVSCNSRPIIRGSDDGIWDRILLVPWKVRFSDEEKREHGARVVAELHDELPGVLNWLIEGLQDYRELGGLAPPESVREASHEYRIDSDPIGRFISDCCELAEDAEHEAVELYDAFKRWAREEGTSADRISTANGFGQKLTNRGIGRRKSDGFVYRQGLTLKLEVAMALRSDKEAKKQRDAARAKDEPEGDA